MEGVTGSLQLVLALGHAESFARDDFIAGASNAAAVKLVDRWPDWPSRIMALVGEEGSGKTHLAAAWGENAGARFLSGRLLDEADLPAALSTGALVVEDLTPQSADEIKLFHLLNLAQQQNAFLLLTARWSPTLWPAALPDLASRLRALPVVELAPPDERLLRALMHKLAADRQIELDGALIDFLFARIERSFAGVREAMAKLDREAMRKKRPVNKALAAEVFRAP
jgi:chromosomal replication initiation ATPase DnaA